MRLRYVVRWGWASCAVALAACDSAPPPMTCAPWADSAFVASRPSPFDSASLQVDGHLAAKLCYSRPSVRGRVVFGELVPYDTLWRTGANEATVLHLAQPTDIAGLVADSGDYSLYTVPNPAQWQVVLNGAAGHWGLTRDETGADGVLYTNAYTPEVRAQELGRAPITVEQIPFVEQLTASFESLSANEHRLYVDWETTRVVIPLRLLGEGD